MTKLENCRLEFDKYNGILYIYNNETEALILRICGLNIQSLSNGTIDISIFKYSPALICLFHEQSQQ